MIRFGMRLTDELYQVYKEKSEKSGIPMSMLVLMDLETINESRQAQKTLHMLDGLMNKATDMKDNNSQQVQELLKQVEQASKNVLKIK